MLDNKIITFLRVCDTMNYTRAAEELHITQPAVSHHIHCLEEEYGVRLFEFKNKKISLTAQGVMLRRYANAMHNDEKVIAHELSQPFLLRHDLRLGTTKTVGDFAIARPLQSYMENHPDTDMHIIVGNTEELLSQLHSGAIHMALVEGYYPIDEFESVKYSTEDFICVSAAGHKFSNTPESIEDLTGETLLVREPGSGTREILQRGLSLKNLTVNSFSRAVEIGSMHVILSLVEGDFGISFMYKRAASQAIEAGSLREVRLNDFHVKHDFTFIWNKGSIHDSIYSDVCKSFMKSV
ncbi:LysR family transcriptional regulator [Aminicella lysinilytica]|uniref:DNA-binding transcriptional LysR family regulator n=1 Tax=Aminicella lysinilytica TaxID=433323 RepID=A0A4V3CQV9_9FIRM|nr:LysR family transcriptional regulator [Aminicella lysinilytica]TDP50360.1 DNA-binding transcriptional LysR family regulator [Aminicella lysinilytica]